MKAYREENGLADDAAVPVDAVTASGSGLDPQISVANARLQAARVADERGLELDEVLALIDEHTEGRSLGFLGEPGVNVLELNLALDDLCGASSVDVPGHGGHDGVGPVEQASLERERALVVEELLPPSAHHELGDDDRDRVVGPSRVGLVEEGRRPCRRGPGTGRSIDLEGHPEVELVPLGVARRSRSSGRGRR